MNVVITGSSAGIGRAITTHLMAQEHYVMGLARSPQWDLKSEEGQFNFQTVDVSDWRQVERSACYLPHHWGGTVHALICCAGIQRAAGRTLGVSPAEWGEVIRTNLDGTFHAIHAFAPLMEKARRPKIVCFSGGGSMKARPRFAAYAASKIAVLRLMETIAAEEGARLDINAIAPGRINTRLLDEMLARGPEVIGEVEFAASQEQKEEGGASIEKVLSLVDWLLSEKSDGTSGQLIAAQWDNWEAK